MRPQDKQSAHVTTRMTMGSPAVGSGQRPRAHVQLIPGLQIQGYKRIKLLVT